MFFAKTLHRKVRPALAGTERTWRYLDGTKKLQKPVDALSALLLSSIMSNRCSITGKPIDGPGDAIWDDGEWVSWDYINQALEEPSTNGGLVEDMIVLARNYFEETGRHLPIYGSLGELYAARRFNLDLHQDPKAQGSDGRLGKALVEIKTISPLRDSRNVRVKTSGNFGYLVMVKIDADFRIDAKLIKRSELGKPRGAYFIVSWEKHRCQHNPPK